MIGGRIPRGPLPGAAVPHGLVVAACSCGLVAASGAAALSRRSLTSPPLRAAVETAVGACALPAAGFLSTRLKRLGGLAQGDRRRLGILLAGAFALAVVWLSRRSVTSSPGLLPWHDVIRIAAGTTVVGLMLRVLAEARRGATEQSAAAERRRLARDLHDSLAQDLAFIAAHAARLAEASGGDDPIVIAARRALAALRGAIVDLSASDAPTTEQALRIVGEELAHRHAVRVDVTCDAPEVTPEARAGLVRIVREAIVNAALHGDARNVWVTLSRDRRGLTLRIDDDGAGFGREKLVTHGFGLRLMSERAAELGGQLSTGRREGGGTAVEVVVP